MYAKTLPCDPERDLAPITQLSYGTPPDEFIAKVRADLPKWQALIRDSGTSIE